MASRSQLRTRLTKMVKRQKMDKVKRDMITIAIEKETGQITRKVVNKNYVYIRIQLRGHSC